MNKKSKKNNKVLQSGYIFAPYIPLIVSPTIFDPNNFDPNNFNPLIGKIKRNKPSKKYQNKMNYEFTQEKF